MHVVRPEACGDPEPLFAIYSNQFGDQNSPSVPIRHGMSMVGHPGNSSVVGFSNVVEIGSAIWQGIENISGHAVLVQSSEFLPTAPRMVRSGRLIVNVRLRIRLVAMIGKQPRIRRYFDDSISRPFRAYILSRITRWWPIILSHWWRRRGLRLHRPIRCCGNDPTNKAKYKHDK